MTIPFNKNSDPEDCDCDDNEKMDDKNICPECGEYKNSYRKMCDQCLFTNQ